MLPSMMLVIWPMAPCAKRRARHTLGLILSLTRQIAPLSGSVKAGGWKRPLPLPKFYALRDLTIGVAGCGRIGREVIARLKPFKARILVHDPFVGAETIATLGVQPLSLEQLYAESDIVTLHCPSMPETRRMINAGSLAQMKDGVFLINVARGTLVDQQALIEALQSGYRHHQPGDRGARPSQHRHHLRQRAPRSDYGDVRPGGQGVWSPQHPDQQRRRRLALSSAGIAV
jgi:phosphoglycerate dehydrogenase-like enzyme